MTIIIFGVLLGILVVVNIIMWQIDIREARQIEDEGRDSNLLNSL